MAAVQTSSNISQSLLDSVNGSRNSTKSSTAATQDRFMKLLVEQLKNQDPLNPMDNAQVTSQMAQLSTVTGIDKLNTTMESLISSVQGSQSYQASGMIGHNVLVAGNKLTLDSKGAYLGVELPSAVDKVNIDIKNTAGVVVKTIELSKTAAGVTPLQWDGITKDGATAPKGEYTFTASATAGGEKAVVNALNFASVTSVSTSGTGVKLNLSNLASVSTSDIKEIF